MTSAQHTSTPLNPSRERGIAVMLTALLLVFTIPVVGLAIDAGLLYLVRSKLSSACDAAALATARNLNLGMTLPAQMANAQARGVAFFNANFPTGYLGTSGITPTVLIDDSSATSIRVTVSATGDASLYFMRILGPSVSVASASGQASRRSVNIIMLLDRSASMNGAPCTAMKNASTTFVDLFVNGRDRLGMVSFGTTVSRDYAPTLNFKNPAAPLSAAINSIACTQATNISDGYSEAYQMLEAINEPLAANIILLFTDGAPNVYTADFPVKLLADVRLSSACPNSSIPCNRPPSPCASPSPKRGAASASLGLWQTIVPPSSTLLALIPASQRVGCSFPSTFSLSDDIAFVPNQDVYNVSTSGYMDSALPRYPTGHAYDNRIRIDMGAPGVPLNLCDNAAKKARDHPDLKIVTYAIGLGFTINHDLLRRMTNDLSSPIYDNTKLNGLYIHAPTIADINTAYSRIAGEVLRLSN
jgi:Flp pilus assembly protein TadG